MRALLASWTRLSRTGILLGILWLLQPAFGAVPANSTTNGPAMLFFDSWPVEGAWEPTAVTTVLQAHDGYLWLGTYHGLVRFDGVRFTVFDSSKVPSLRNGLITALYEDRERVLWIGHETGDLTRLQNGEFQPVPLGRTWPGGSIEGITTDEHGDLWLLNPGGTLFRVRDGRCTEAPGGASPSQKACLVRATDGKLWVSSNGRVASVEHGRTVAFEFDRNPSGFYEWITCTRGGGLWVYGNGRLRKWREGQWVDEMTGGPTVPGAVTTLLETRSGALLVGTVKDGLYILRQNQRPLHFSRANGLSHNWVRALCEDHEGNLWLGTGSGFDGLRPRKVQMLAAPEDGWQGCAILSFIVRPDGTAWVGTEGSGLYQYEYEHWTRYAETNGLTNVFVWSVLETREGQLFVGTWGGGVQVKRGERFESPGELSKITAPVLALFQGSHGELWIGTTVGLYRYENGKLTWFAGKDKLALPDVRAITESADGTLWFGMSGGGLGAFKDGTLKQFRKADGLASDFVVCLYADPDGTLWFGTSDNGLGCWQQGRFAVVSTDQGLPTSIISHIVDDGVGNLWLGTQRGIVRVAKTELRHCANGEVKTVRSLSYGKAEGLASLACSGGFQPGACQAANGRLWFPTSRGLALVDPVNVAANPVPPPVVIEALRVDGQPVALPHAAADAAAGAPALRISPGKQRLEFSYAGLSFAAPEKVRFRYRLDGLEHDWVEAGTKRVAEYSYLRPGTYTFHVTACNNDEVWNAVGTSLGFIVLPHVWQTWWFQGLALLSGAGAIGAGVLWVSRRRVRRRLEQLEHQRAVERERARIARDIHDELGASLTRITLLGQTARSDLEAQSPAAANVEQIYNTARELTRSMDEIVWAVNPKHDTLDSLVTYLGRFAQHFLSAAQIRCRLDLPLHPPAWALTSEVRHNVFLAFKEALHNVLKHAGASEVHISLEVTPAGFTLVVADNGRGFDAEVVQHCPVLAGDGTRASSGNGLLNMQKRLEEIGGRCSWDTAPGEGTRAKLSVTLKT